MKSHWISDLQTHTHAKLNRNLSITMDSSGRYVLRYEPSDYDTEYLQVSIEMSISDEATFDDMANFFDSFLRASGYVYDGEVKVVRNQKLNQHFNDTMISGASGTDTISFGAARPAMEFGAKTLDDVFSFG